MYNFDVIFLHLFICSCAKLLRKNLKSGKYLQYQSVKEGKIHSLVFPRENLSAINSQLERSELHPKGMEETKELQGKEVLRRAHSS